MDDNEHQHIKDLRALNGWDETMPGQEVARREAIRLSMMSPLDRTHHIRATENRVMSYDAAKSNLRTQTQGWRLVQTLKTAHERLKATGR
jgi:hypothetical protein